MNKGVSCPSFRSSFHSPSCWGGGEGVRHNLKKEDIVYLYYSSPHCCSNLVDSAKWLPIEGDLSDIHLALNLIERIVSGGQSRGKCRGEEEQSCEGHRNLECVGAPTLIQHTSNAVRNVVPWGSGRQLNRAIPMAHSCAQTNTMQADHSEGMLRP